MSTIRASMVSRPIFSARSTSPPLWLTVPPITRRARGLRHRHRLAGHHGFVDERISFGDDAIDRDLLAGAHPQADRRPRSCRSRRPRRRAPLIRRAVFGASPSSARIAPEVRSRARNSSTWPSSTSTVMTAAASKYTATAPCMSRNAGRKPLRRQRADHAVEPGHAGAHRDQREHVEIARHDRMPAAHEKRRAGPQHHRRRQHQRNPVRPWHRQQMHQAEMAAHLEHEHRNGQRQRDPESPGHVDQFGIWRIVERDLLGLQRHAADRATAGTDLPHLGMHRTGVDRAGRRRRLRLAAAVRNFSGSAAKRSRQRAPQNK